MEDKHYYLVRRDRGKRIELIYNYATFTKGDGTTEHDILVVVFYDQKKRELWGWDCGTSRIDYEEDVTFEEVLAEVPKEDVDALFGVMKEATEEAAKWMDSNWPTLNEYRDTPCSCMCGGDKYPYFTFWNNETCEQVVMWSDLLVHNTIVYGFICPDGDWGKYYGIPVSVFEKACALHREMSDRFVHQYRDLVLRLTGVTIPLKEHTATEIEE